MMMMMMTMLMMAVTAPIRALGAVARESCFRAMLIALLLTGRDHLVMILGSLKGDRLFAERVLFGDMTRQQYDAHKWLWGVLLWALS